MTRLLIVWDYDSEDDVQRSAESEVFFSAWVNQFGDVEYTCTQPDLFADLMEQMES